MQPFYLELDPCEVKLFESNVAPALRKRYRPGVYRVESLSHANALFTSLSSAGKGVNGILEVLFSGMESHLKGAAKRANRERKVRSELKLKEPSYRGGGGPGDVSGKIKEGQSFGAKRQGSRYVCVSSWGR